MDEKREAGVWQRVTAQPRQMPGEDVDTMLRESMALAAVYHWAAGKLEGRKKHLAQQLLRAEEATGACLRGIGRLSGQTVERVTVWEPGSRGGKGLLEGCYQRTRHCQSEYTARSLDPQFGEVYRHLADRAGKQCVLLVQLLGWK